MFRTQIYAYADIKNIVEGIVQNLVMLYGHIWSVEQFGILFEDRPKTEYMIAFLILEINQVHRFANIFAIFYNIFAKI